MLARFDIVLVAFPFTDGPNVKPRSCTPGGESWRVPGGSREADAERLGGSQGRWEEIERACSVWGWCRWRELEMG
jgi:hypothetical protein